MKTKNLMFLGLIFILLLNFTVLAAETVPTYYRVPQQADAAQQAAQWTESATKFLNTIVTAVFRFNIGVSWEEIIVSLAVFAILAIVFSDALITTSPLSRNPAIAVAILLTVIVAFTGMIREAAKLLLGIVAGFGVFAVFVVLAGCFIAYFIFHGILFRHLQEKKIIWEARKKAAEEKAAQIVAHARAGKK